MNLTDFIHSCNSLFCSKQKGLLAVSGGLDSSVLCELMHQAGFSFAIAHCNFHLRPGDCDRDERFVRSLAERYGVAVYVAQFQTEAYASQHSLSIEEAARNLRYQFFEQTLSAEGFDYVATAHHRDDAAETFFINLLRGTGLAGLHGIPARNGNVVRPLLPFGRDEIAAFAATCQLDHVEDYTNATDAYRRNQIRHHLIPLMRQLSPTFDRTMQFNMERLRDAEQLYCQAVAQCRERVVRQSENGCFIRLEDLQNLTPQRTLLFELLRPYGFSIGMVDDLLAHLHNPASIAGVQYQSPSYRIIRDREGFWIVPKSCQKDTSKVILLDDVPYGQTPLVIPLSDKKELQVSFSHPSGNYQIPPQEALFDVDRIVWPLTLRHWQTGDRFRPFGMRGTQLLSDYFTDHKFSHVQKEQAWLLCDNSGSILWLVGHRMADYRIIPTTQRVLNLRFSVQTP